MNVQLADNWKVGISRLMRRRPFGRLLALGVQLAVPRQRMGVALVTFNANEEVLLLRHVFRSDNPWGLPGGWLGRNESPADCIKRELREELNLSIDLGPVIHVAHESPPSHIVMAYLGRLCPGQMRFSGEILEARWFSIDRLPRPLWAFTDEAILSGLEYFRATTHRPATMIGEVQQPA